jgi:uncharacterized protein YndB with AHSA1/START domain
LKEINMATKAVNVGTIYHQVWINAPLAKLYEALSTLEGIVRWWGPHQSTKTDTGLVLEHDPGPAHGVVRFKVLATVQDKRVEWEFISTHPKSSPASAWTGTHVMWEISERENVVALSGFGKDGDRIAILEFRHSGWDGNSEYFGFCNYHWGEALQQLKQVCEAQ